MLYRTPINEITWADIEDFCRQQIRENSLLDYKRDFPENLEKTIAAMANTNGGIILIGIEDDDNLPKLPINGIQHQRGLAERVTNIILERISPPVLPETQVCLDDTGAKAVIVIRIPQSHQTPHSVKGTTVYFRTNNVTSPESLMTLENIEWLLDNRKISTTLKSKLYTRADERYFVFKKRTIQWCSDHRNSFRDNDRGFFTITVCPTYPKPEYLNPSQLYQTIDEFKTRDYYGTNDHFPFHSYRVGDPYILQDGVALVGFEFHRQGIFYSEFNSRGLYFYRQSIMAQDDLSETSKLIINGGEILIRVDEFIDTAIKFYEKIGYQGYIDLSVSLSKIQEQTMDLGWLRHLRINSRGKSPDDEVSYFDTILASNLSNIKKSYIIEAAKRLFWAFSLDFKDNYLEILMKPYHKAV